ncbi:MAG TPA: LpqB family beta-propeller domain-containing protein [Pyrinomonadaceae bacterium]|nr:LpqB family beta-propeller domain-containing protein [Pyrinomonadaceae bacterium]
MDEDRWQRVEKLYHAALEQESGARTAFLFQSCAGDEELRREVEGLLKYDRQAASLILTQAAEPEARAVAAETTTKELAQESNSSAIPRQIGPYKLISLLGQGGMGEVHLALDTRLNRKVAIKVLPAEFTAERDRVRRFEQEARAASALNHPNILTVHEIDQLGGRHYLVTEYVEGETLRQRMTALPRRRMKPREALIIASQVASALQATHEAGIIHRDIKPENVMVRKDGLVKVLDFGVAKYAQPEAEGPASETLLRTAAGTVIGTAAYMSPEQVRGGLLDERTDLWSLGVVLYEMVAGRRPFSGDTAMDLMAAILEVNPAPFSADGEVVSEPLERIVAKALQKKKEARYQTAAEFHADLESLKHRSEVEVDSGSAAVRGSSGEAERRTQSDLQTAETKRDEAAVVRAGGIPRPRSGAEHLISELPRHKRGALLTLMILLIAAAGIGFVLYKFMGQDQSKPALPAVRIVPFTSFQGSELHPSFSPDGDQIAFAWNGEKGDNYDLYVKRNDSGSPPLRLTTNPADDLYPAWSPDGHHIAFVRQSGSEMGIFLVPALGGPERMLYSGTSAFFTLFEHGNGLSWSPDGESLGFSGRDSPSEPNSIFLLSVESLEKRKITSPPVGFLGDSTPAFSPDGKTLAFMRRSSVGTGGHIYVLPTSGNGSEPKLLAIDNSAQISMTTRSLAWTMDSREIVFAQSGGLWRVLASGGIPALLEGSVENTVSLAISHQGNRLAFSQAVADTNIWQVELRGPMGKRGNPTNLISSTRTESSPQFSPDGKRIAFASSRAGGSNIWISDSEGLNSIQLTYLPGPTDVGSPRWSPDGQQIAFHSTASGNRDIYVLGAEGGKPRLLTEDNAEDVRPSWSRDGEWIYFGSNRTGDWQVWKAPAKGGQAIQVTRHGGREAFESLDGKFVYYSKDSAIPGIWRITATGGEEIRVLDEGVQGFWALLDVGIYFVNTKARPRPTIEFFNFATGQTTRITAIEKELELVFPSLSISPDGRKILYVQVDRRESDIMLMENFR